jgi:2-polyprenyl-3-methyl-5-hydroxy-6-metoxy-1,4-benzoquinol methylase
MDKAYEHFSAASTTWSNRYSRTPRNIWDLDLVMRREHLHRMLALLLAEKKGQKVAVLDAGCGTGDALDGISREQVAVVGFDVVPDMVRASASRHPEDTYRTASFEDLPFQPDSKDVVICLGVLEYLGDVPEAIRRVHEELRAGGQFIVSFPNGASWLRKLSRWVVGVEEFAAITIRGLQGRQRNTSLPQYAHRSWTLDEVEHVLLANGFDIEQVLFNTVGVAGCLGNVRPAMKLSRWWTERYRESRRAGARFGMTMLIRARKRS